MKKLLSEKYSQNYLYCLGPYEETLMKLQQIFHQKCNFFVTISDQFFFQFSEKNEQKEYFVYVAGKNSTESPAQDPNKLIRKIFSEKIPKRNFIRWAPIKKLW